MFCVAERFGDGNASHIGLDLDEVNKLTICIQTSMCCTKKYTELWIEISFEYYLVCLCSVSPGTKYF